MLETVPQWLATFHMGFVCGLMEHRSQLTLMKMFYKHKVILAWREWSDIATLKEKESQTETIEFLYKK